MEEYAVQMWQVEERANQVERMAEHQSREERWEPWMRVKYNADYGKIYSSTQSPEGEIAMTRSGVHKPYMESVVMNEHL